MGKIRVGDIPSFSPGQLRTICQGLADTHTGLTGSEIAQLLAQCRIKDVDPTNTKWRRLHNALVQRINEEKHCGAVLSVIRHALDPAAYSGRARVFEERRRAVNVALAFVGLEFTETGKFARVTAATTLSEAERRADRLRAALEVRGVHPDVIRFCRAELLEDNCFHAVLEATKSVAAKIRRRSGLRGDGGTLVDAALGGQAPALRINELATESEWSEHRGFGNLLKGMFGVFRNPTAHEARVEWMMSEEDALDLFVVASYAHRRIDRATVQR